MKHLFALLLLTAASTCTITGCGGNVADIPVVDPAEQAAVDAEAEKGMEAAMQEQAGGN